SLRANPPAGRDPRVLRRVSSAGSRLYHLDAPQTQPSSARLQRQQAGRGRLKPGVRQNRVTTALGARRLLGLPLQNATCLLASTPCPSSFNQLWRWGPGRDERGGSTQSGPLPRRARRGMDRPGRLGWPLKGDGGESMRVHTPSELIS
ncbi:hypothetical protein THAOC_35724, partial [Thalassiosira oceanica]